MAYIRTKGNQLAVVHGERDPETGKVEQKTLFTLYSKAEALAAIGDQSGQFRRILEDENPRMRFDWAKLDAGIRDHLDHLPDVYEYKKARQEGGFREALRTFSRELLLNDPQTLISSARLIQANRHELTWLRQLIDWRLAVCDQEESEWNQDNPFHWRLTWMRQEVPGSQWETLAELYDQCKYDEVEALAGLLTECWPNFAQGFNYLGLVAMRRGRHQEAAARFDEAMRVSRAALPKRIRKEMWWSDHETRPYIRAIIYQAQALTRLGDYTGALQLCDRLESECHQDIAAADERAPIYLCAGRWEDAIKAARYVSELYPTRRFLLAFAHAESGNRDESLAAFLHGAIQHPRAAHLLLSRRTDHPEGADEIMDHNAGVDLLDHLGAYLERLSPELEDWFTTILEAPAVKAAIAEYQKVRQQWRTGRGKGRGRGRECRHEPRRRSPDRRSGTARGRRRPPRPPADHRGWWRCRGTRGEPRWPGSANTPLQWSASASARPAQPVRSEMLCGLICTLGMPEQVEVHLHRMNAADSINHLGAVEDPLVPRNHDPDVLPALHGSQAQLIRPKQGLRDEDGDQPEVRERAPLPRSRQPRRRPLDLVDTRQLRRKRLEHGLPSTAHGVVPEDVVLAEVVDLRPGVEK